MPFKKQIPEDPPLQRATEVLANPTAPTINMVHEYASLATSYEALLRRFLKTVTISDAYETQHREQCSQRDETLARYRQLNRDAVPICMYCKKVRAGSDYWQRLEIFFKHHADIMFSHGICPDCIKMAYSKIGLKLMEGPAPESEDTTPPLPAEHKPDKEDNTLSKLRELVQRYDGENSPLATELEQITAAYGKLLHRFHKTLAISDGYQAQLLALKTELGRMAGKTPATGEGE